MELAKAKKIAEEKKREKLEERLARYMLGCSPLTFPRVHVHKYVTVALSKEFIVLHEQRQSSWSSFASHSRLRLIYCCSLDCLKGIGAAI
jgi:hypothetical protein